MDIFNIFLVFPHYYVLILCISAGILRIGHNDCFPGFVCPKTNEISLVLDISNGFLLLYIQMLLIYRYFLDISTVFR